MSGYSVGERILRNHPIAFVVENSRRAQVCANCFQTDVPVKRCGKCKCVSYCTPDCQKKAWKECHKYECDGILGCEGSVSSFMCLLAQTVLKLALGHDGEDPAKNFTPFKRTFYDLASHWAEAKLDEEILSYVEKAVKTLGWYLRNVDVSKFLEVDVLGEVYSRIKSNAYAIQGPCNEPIGHGVFLSAGKFDHSCRPNACQSYDGPDMLVHAITDIPTLEHVRVTYTSLTQPTRMRRKFLQEQYFFHCECEGCLDEAHDEQLQGLLCQTKYCGAAVPYQPNAKGALKCPQCSSPLPAPVLKKAEVVMRESDGVIAQAEVRLNSGDAAGTIQLLQPVLRAASGLLHIKNYVVCCASLVSSSAYTQLNNYDLAFTFSQNALEGTSFAYPANHIAVASHMLQVVKLGLQLPLRDASLYEDLTQLSSIALDSTQISAGKDSTATRIARDMLEKVTEAGKLVAANGHGCGGSCGGHKHHH